MTPEGRFDRRVAWALFAFAFVLLLATEKPAGFVRDESVYFAAAESYAGWFRLLVQHPTEAFTDAAIVRHFDNNHEHPGLLKNLFGLSYLALHQASGLLRPAAAFRVPAFAFAAFILSLSYLLARRLMGVGPALFAAALWLLVPRQFFESHLACFDVGIAALWLFCVYAFLRAQEAPRWWIVTGLAFGLALASKHNAFFLPVVLIPFSLHRGWVESKGSPTARTLLLAINGVFVFAAVLYGVLTVALTPAGLQAGFTLLSPQVAIFVVALGVGGALLFHLKAAHEGTFRAVAPLVAMVALGPLVLYAAWPYLWHHPVDRTAWWMAFHATHNHYAWFYLGELLRAPPFPLAYVLVKTALTVPTALFVPMVLGLAAVVVRAARRQVTALEVLVVVNALFSIALISLPSVPHFGGVKHWFPSMPFLAVLAGLSLQRGAKGLHGALKPTWAARLSEARVTALLAVLLSVSAIIGGARVYPYGTSHYSELAGGLPGAASLGMQRQFWANNVTGVLAWINANARPGERVYLHECHGLMIRDYQRNGMLRSDLRFTGGPQDADIVAYQYHQEFREQEFNAWSALGTRVPVTGLYVDETPQVVVYRRP